MTPPAGGNVSGMDPTRAVTDHRVSGPAPEGAPARGLDHVALPYRDDDEYAEGVAAFVTAGIAAGEPALVAVPGRGAAVLREALGRTEGVAFADMEETGANPARIIPEVRGFVDAHAGRPVRFVGEPVRPGREGAALREATRHEALLNLAFARDPVAILCPYDAARLPEDVLDDARRTHPVALEGGGRVPCAAFLGAGALPPSCDAPLPEPPGDARTLRLTAPEDLAEARRRAGAEAAAAGLRGAALADLEVAVTEIATNTLRHSGGGGLLRVWREPGRLLCQVDDVGHIRDPLAGRRPPEPGGTGGWGLLLANRLCDLVEIRTRPGATSVRLHMAAPAATPPRPPGSS